MGNLSDESDRLNFNLLMCNLKNEGMISFPDCKWPNPSFIISYREYFISGAKLNYVLSSRDLRSNDIKSNGPVRSLSITW